MSQHILILEDMPDTQKWLKDSCLLAFPDARITLCNSLSAATEFLTRIEPALALLDIELPDGKGNHIIAPLLAQYPSCICVIVTIYADENHLLPSLSAGAKGYILKDQSRQRIAAMLTQAMAGELPLSPAVAAMVLNHFSTSADTANESPLTSRETQVLTLIGSGASTPEVANQLNISKYTVEDHLKQIYRKLEISNRAEAALAARALRLI
ncbi:MAG: response regulator transcription factor [Pseudohongiellaceae bacterium]